MSLHISYLRWWQWAAVVALALCALGGAAWAIGIRGDGDGPRSAKIPTPAPIEHAPLSDGWQPLALSLPDDVYSLRALDVADAGVAVGSAFELTSREKDLEPDRVGAMLRVEPPLALKVEGGGGERLRIKPEQPMRRETAYRFSLVDPDDNRELGAWAFQTESPLRVVQTLPRDRTSLGTGGNAGNAAPTSTGIELTFSHDGVTGVEERFHIDPSVAGRFETHKRVVVFVPKDLAFETLYTVTLDAGVSSGDLTMEESFSFSFETGSTTEREAQRYDQGPTFARAMNESATGSEPVLEIYGNQTGDQELPVDVFRYANAAAITGAMEQLQDVPQWAFWRRREFRLDTAGLERVASFRVKPVQQRKGYYDASFIVFPDQLESGFYLVQASTDKGTAQTLLQVTDLAAYANVSQTKTLVWVNDLSTKRPVEGASVDDGGDTHRTGTDGVALFDTPDELLPGAQEETPQYRPGLITVEHDGRIALVPLGNTSPIGSYGQYDYYPGQYYPYYGGASPEFWSYLYPERHLYRKTDEVSFWGIAKRRERFRADETITVRLTGGQYYDFNYAPTVIAETAVALSEFGSFEGKLPFEGVAPGYYTLEARAGEDVIATTYLQIENFVKPAYKIDIVPSRNAVVAGDVVTFDITSRFFEGSPVPFVELSYGGDLAPGGELRVTTDAEGKASLPYVAAGYDPLRPSIRQIYARPVGPEESEITSQAGIYVLPATVTIDAEASTESGGATVSGRVSDVDFAAFDEPEQQQYGGYGDYTSAPVAGSVVTARVIEITYSKTEIGETYDFIAKVSRKEYRYDTIETPAGTYTATTGPDGGYEIQFAVKPDASYRVELAVPDSAGRTAAASAWVSGDLPYYQSYGDNSLYLSETDSPQGTPYYQQQLFASGESVDLTMRRGPENSATGEDISYLFYRAQSGLRTYNVQPEGRYRFAFDAADAPNIMVGGVQFNGSGYDAPYGEFVAPYDYGEREIEVQVTADRERYEPGDEITLAVETRDRDGNGVAAEALVSGVDEALLRLQGSGYEEPMLAQLHRSLPSGVLTTYVPAFAAGLLSPPQPGGRGGGGGGGAIPAPDTGGPATGTRSNFRDIAVFQSVRTDGNGRGSVTFTLPDNITSWRLASRAVTEDLRGGESVTSVPVGLPFFVEATMGNEYLVSDRPVIKLRAFGTALRGGEPVEYILKAPSLGAADVTAPGFSLSGTDVALPPLAEGMHEITIEARSGALSDAIIRTIRVVPSRLRKGDARFYELGAGGETALEGAAEARIRVVVSDYNRGRYYDDLLQLSWGYGDRVDQLLARSLAQEMLKTYFDVEDTGIPVDFDASLYQTQDDGSGSGTFGGIALFPYADDELILSARVAAAAPERFGKNGLQQYFRSVLDSPLETRERAIIALFGLAASGAPVLPAIDTAAAAADLTVRERLYLGLAALAAGNEGVAREQYRQVMLGHAEERAPFVRVRTGADQDDIIEATSLAAELGAGLGDASAAPMFEYTMANRTTDMLVELEQLAYLARALPKLPSEPVTFSYRLDGTERQVTLEKGRTLTLDLTPAELAALNARPVEGRVGIATFFEAPFDPATEAVDADATLRRVIDVDGGGIAEGDLVQVRLDYTLAPQSLDGCYQITDLAPSGLRPVTRARTPIISADVLSPYLVDGQKVAFCAYRNSMNYPAVYWARVVTKGSYTAEPATIQSQQSASSFNFAPGNGVEIP